MSNLLTKANINDYLVNHVGISAEEVGLMPRYTKLDLVKDDMELFNEYILQEEEEDE